MPSVLEYTSLQTQGVKIGKVLRATFNHTYKQGMVIHLAIAMASFGAIDTTALYLKYKPGTILTILIFVRNRTRGIDLIVRVAQNSCKCEGIQY